MAVRTKTQFETLYGTTGTVFPDNTTGEISEADVRAFGQDIADSFQRISASVQSVTSAGTVTANASTDDSVHITAQAEALTLANPTGTAGEDQMLIYRIKDNGTARAISYGSEFRAMGTTLPTTTILSKTLYLACVRNVTDTKWDVIAVVQQA